jgi:hypothetical protein
MSSYLFGIDVAPTRAAVAVITRRVSGDLIAVTASFTSRAPRGEERVADLVSVVDRATCEPALAAVGPSTAHPVEDLRSAVLAALHARSVPVHVIPAAEQVLDVAELWPAVNLANVGEVTALRLAHAGALRLGWPVDNRRGAA